VIQSAICDTQTESRKGRKPISGRAMTPAERKQRQRDKANAERGETPRWLQLRHDIWQLVQERFMFANAAELANALKAISAAITFTNTSRLCGATDDELVKFLATALGNREPDKAINAFAYELLPYKANEFSEVNLPGFHGAILFEVIRDMLNGSRIEDDADQQTADVDE